MLNDSSKLFNIEIQSVSIFYIDMSGAGEISISSEDDFTEMI